MKFNNVLKLSFVLISVVPILFVTVFYHMQNISNAKVTVLSNIDKQVSDLSTRISRDVSTHLLYQARLMQLLSDNNYIECFLLNDTKSNEQNQVNNEGACNQAEQILRNALQLLTHDSLLNITHNNVNVFSLSNIRQQTNINIIGQQVSVDYYNGKGYISSQVPLSNLYAAYSRQAPSLQFQSPAEDLNDFSAINTSEITGSWYLIDSSEKTPSMIILPSQSTRDVVLAEQFAENIVNLINEKAIGKQHYLMHNSPTSHQSAWLSSRKIANTNWTLLYIATPQEMDDLIARNSPSAVLVPMLIIFISLLFAILASIWLSRPIKRLVNNIEDLQSGKSSGELNHSPWKEIQGVTQHFAQLVEKNQQISRDLNKRIIDRTVDLNKAVVELRELADHDAETGLYNERYLKQRMTQETNRASRYKSPMTIVVFEIENLENIRKKHGEQATSEVVVTVAQFLKQSLRGCDIVARTGKQQFCIVLTGDAATEVYELIDKLQSAFSSMSTTCIPDTFTLSCSFGVNNVIPQTNSTTITDFTQLFTEANIALSQAMQNGVGKVASYVPPSGDNSID